MKQGFRIGFRACDIPWPDSCPFKPSKPGLLAHLIKLISCFPICPPTHHRATAMPPTNQPNNEPTSPLSKTVIAMRCASLSCLSFRTCPVAIAFLIFLSELRLRNPPSRFQPQADFRKEREREREQFELELPSSFVLQRQNLVHYVASCCSKRFSETGSETGVRNIGPKHRSETGLC